MDTTEVDAYREALRQVVKACEPYYADNGDNSPSWDCGGCSGWAIDRPNAPSTAADIKHFDGCAYVAARDVLAQFSGV